MDAGIIEAESFLLGNLSTFVTHYISVAVEKGRILASTCLVKHHFHIIRIDRAFDENNEKMKRFAVVCYI